MTWGFTRRNARFQFHHFYLLQEKNPNYAAKEESGFEKKTETRANECHTNARLFEAYGRCCNLYLFDCLKAFYFYHLVGSYELNSTATVGQIRVFIKASSSFFNID